MNKELKRQGFTDRYDPDFIIGTIRQFLIEQDAALTGGGVKRFKR